MGARRYLWEGVSALALLVRLVIEDLSPYVVMEALQEAVDLIVQCAFALWLGIFTRRYPSALFGTLGQDLVKQGYMSATVSMILRCHFRKKADG